MLCLIQLNVRYDWNDICCSEFQVLLWLCWIHRSWPVILPDSQSNAGVLQLYRRNKARTGPVTEFCRISPNWEFHANLSIQNAKLNAKSDNQWTCKHWSYPSNAGGWSFHSDLCWCAVRTTWSQLHFRSQIVSILGESEKICAQQSMACVET